MSMLPNTLPFITIAAFQYLTPYYLSMKMFDFPFYVIDHNKLVK